MNELLQQLMMCVTTSTDSNGKQTEIVDVYSAVPLIIQILQKMNNV